MSTPRELEPVPLPPDGIGAHAASAALWLAGLAWMLPWVSVIGTLNSWVGPERIDWMTRFYGRAQIALTGSRWRAHVHPDVDPNQPYLFAQNHTNHFDYLYLYPATPHFKQGLELESHFRYPIYGWAMKARGTIPVRPGSVAQARENLRAMRDEIRRGHSILTFPEGTRSLDGRVGCFRTGVFRIARELGVPVVPVAVTGAYDVMRKGSLLIRPAHTIRIHVEKPEATAGLSEAEIPALAARVRATVAAHVDRYWDERRRALASGTHA